MSYSGNFPLKAMQTGIPIKKDACIVIVKTEWNNAIVDRLADSCLQTLNEYEITDVRIFIVPGAFELPFAIRSIHAGSSNKIDAIIAFGCIIKGGTPHFDYVSKAVTDGIAYLNLQLDCPVIFGVLTVNNEEQALERTGGKEGNKGTEAALSAIKMLSYTIQKH